MESLALVGAVHLWLTDRLKELPQSTRFPACMKGWLALAACWRGLFYMERYLSAFQQRTVTCRIIRASRAEYHETRTEHSSFCCIVLCLPLTGNTYIPRGEGCVRKPDLVQCCAATATNVSFGHGIFRSLSSIRKLLLVLLTIIWNDCPCLAIHSLRHNAYEEH